jgi:hypothetical protein
MQGDLTAPVPQVDESMWLYFACDCASERPGSSIGPVAELVRDLGWHVLERAASGAHGPDALVHADACIADLGCPAGDLTTDLAAAHRAGRPILALQPAGAESSSATERLLADYDRARVVTFSGSEECMARVREALTDRGWLTAIHQGDA